VPSPDHRPTALEVVAKAWKEAGRATAEEIATATDLDLKTVRNAASGLLRDGVLADTGDKAGRSRILIPHSQSTKGTGTGMTEEAGVVGPLAPSTNGHKTAAGTNGHKTVPTEAPELAVEQAATAHNGITGEHGHQEVESPRERRRREWREEIAINDPQLFYAMPEEDRRQLLSWVRENVAARRGKGVRDSYWLKHEAEHRLGFYVSNAELKGDMLEAGHRPVWGNRINMVSAVPPSRAAPGVTSLGRKPRSGGSRGSHNAGRRKSWLRRSKRSPKSLSVSTPRCTRNTCSRLQKKRRPHEPDEHLDAGLYGPL